MDCASASVFVCLGDSWGNLKWVFDKSWVYAAHFKPPPSQHHFCPCYATVHTRLIKSLLMNSVNDFYGSRALMKIEAVQCRGEGKEKRWGAGEGSEIEGWGEGGQCSLGQCVITLSIIQSELADARKSARRQFVRISGSPPPFPSLPTAMRCLFSFLSLLHTSLSPLYLRQTHVLRVLWQIQR